MKKKTGFTMIELMIVIAIIIPKMTEARDKSKLETCKTNLKHIGIAMELYAADYKGEGAIIREFLTIAPITGPSDR